ncbi:MAG: NAD-dependent epimerase/dehydratase family protein [Saccharofermentanales bacterium]|jgi:nucleoside-diphosphate-sugar epimerase
MKVLLIGGTGNISMSITKRLLERGDEVYLFNRGNNRECEALGAHYIIGDAFDSADLKAKVGDQKFDVVANFILFTPEQAQMNYEVFAGRTGQYFFISSCTVYQKPILKLPITPDTPLRNPYSLYARNKIACEDYFTKQYRDNNFPITIVRPSHTYGETKLVVGPLMGWAVPHWTLADRILKGEPIIVHDLGRTFWTATHSDDFAYAFCGLMGNHEAIGHAFHITNDDPHTWDAIMGMYGQILGVEPKIVHVPTTFIGKLYPEKYNAILGDMSENAIFDIRKLQKFVPGYRTRILLREGLTRSVNWYWNHPEARRIDEENNRMTDHIIKAWQDVLK